MSELADITAAPVRFTVKGKECLFRPLSYKMIGEFEKFAMGKYLDEVEAVLERSKASNEWKETRRQQVAIIAERLKFNQTRDEDAEAWRVMDRIVTSFEGVTYLTWLSTRDSGITLDEVSEQVSDVASRMAAIGAFNRANGFASPLKKSGE